MLFNTCNCNLGALSISRRGLLCAGGAGFVSALIGTLVGTSRTAQAEALGSRVPEVDWLAVRIVTDTHGVNFVPSEKRDGLAIERRGSNLTPDAPPRTNLHGEWGLSMYAESKRGNEMRNILVDFGYTPETLLNNMSILKIDPSTFDALVLTCSTTPPSAATKRRCPAHGLCRAKIIPGCSTNFAARRLL